MKSPINYTGNKYRLLEEIKKRSPHKIKKMLDLFCGSGTVGLNFETEETFFVDNNIYLINLLKYLNKISFEKLILKIEKLINKYNLTNSYKSKISYPKNEFKEKNQNGYLKLRKHYNLLINKNTSKANTMLFLLLLYSFNGNMRFNKKEEFNMPLGKTDLNKTTIKKLKIFFEKTKGKKLNYLCEDFCNEKIKEIIKKVDFIYIDPPYLITTAVYNETNNWNEEKEKNLLKLIDYIISIKKPFILSNVIEKAGKENIILKKWLQKNVEKVNLDYINFSYGNAHYHKKDKSNSEIEVMIYNY